MASARGIRAGAAYVELFVSDSKLVRGLASAAKKLKAFGDAITGWGRRMTAIGAAVTAPLIGSAKAFSEMGDRMAKLSRRTGISVGTLSELAYAAELSGAGVDTLEGSLRKMQKAIVEAAEGSQSANDALGKLGLTVADLRGLSPDQQFKLIAERLSQIQSPAVKAALAMELFGKSGTQLLPLMSEGAKGIEALQRQARDLGLTMSTEDARAAEALNDAFDTLWKVIKQGVFVIGSALASALRGVSEWIIRAVVTTTAWIKENKDLVVTILKVAAAVVAGGVAVMLLGYAVTAVGTILGALAAALSAAGTAFGVLGSIIAALVSPVGLVVAALAALGAYLIYVSGMGGQALQWLGERFADLSDFASESFRGISGALVAGDIALAAKILWLVLRIAWVKGVQILESAWLRFRGFFVQVAYDAFHGVRALWEVVGNALVVAWIELSAFAAKTWLGIASSFSKAWGTAISWTEKRLHDLHGLMDSSFDADTARNMADQNLAEDNRRIDRQTQAALAQREALRRDERESAEQVHRGELGRIGQESLDKEQELDDEHARKRKKSRDELDAARKAWHDAIGEARRKRRTKDTDGPPRLQGPPGIPDYLEGLGPTIERAQKTIGVSGTFNALEARGLAGGGVTDRIAKASEETAKNTKKLLGEAQGGGLVFV